MTIVLVLVTAFVALYPAALFGGMLVGYAGRYGALFRKPIFAATYIVIVLLAFALFF